MSDADRTMAHSAMVRMSVRAEFSRTRFLAAAQFIARTRGLMAVSLVSVAAVCGARPSSVQRRFSSGQALRRALLNEWIDRLEGIAAGPRRCGLDGLWDLVSAWLLLHARHPMPSELLRTSCPQGASSDWNELCDLAAVAVRKWRAVLQEHADALGAEVWRPGSQGRDHVQALLLVAMGVGPASVALGDLEAIAAGASGCSSILQTAAANRDELFPADARESLVRQAAELIRLRPSFARIDEELRTARVARTERRRRPRMAVAPAPATWDDFLTQATEELREHQRNAPDEEEAELVLDPPDA